MFEKRIPTGRIYPETEKIIIKNGGEVGPQETVLRNIQQERPYLNTGATLVIFKSGDRIYYNERGIWNEVRVKCFSGRTALNQAVIASLYYVSSVFQSRLKGIDS